MNKKMNLAAIRAVLDTVFNFGKLILPIYKNFANVCMNSKYFEPTFIWAFVSSFAYLPLKLTRISNS